MTASEPPAIRAPQPEIVAPTRSRIDQTSVVNIANADWNLRLRAQNRSETAIVRYQIFFKLAVSGRPQMTPVSRPPNSEGTTAPAAPVPSYACNWTYAAYVERDVCFTSISGLVGCTEASVTPISWSGSGAQIMELVSGPGDDTCDLENRGLKQATDAATAQLKAEAQEVYQKTFDETLRPTFRASGVSVVVRRH